MFRKSFISIISVGVILIGGYVGIIAQTAPVNGTVELKKADGTSEPVVGALVEPYRIDIKAALPAAKTNKRGEFAFAGFPFGGTFTLAVSAPGCAPYTFTNVKAGSEKLLITLSPGDGRKFTEDEVRKNAAARSTAGGGGTSGGGTGGGGKTAELTEEQKKAQAEFEAKNKEITAKNEKALKTNEVISRAIKEGNDAYNAKNYDLAVAKYDEGIAADPDFIGSAPIFLNNKGTVLTARAVENYNKAVKLTDASEKVAMYTLVKKDLADASAGYQRAWTLQKNAPATEITDKAGFEATKLGTLRGAKETFSKAVRTEQVDPPVIEAAKVLVPEYLAVETDAAKKTEANIIIADLYRVSGDFANAVTAYKAILETSPDNPDALAGAGLCLFALGAEKNDDKAMYQEGANFLQKFVSVAPDTNKFKPDAVMILDQLKKQQNVTPQKVPSTRKKP